MSPSDAGRASSDPSRQRATCRCNALRFTIPTALALYLAYLPHVATAQGTLKANIPPEVTLCRPVNLTWSGGIPPYRLDAEPFLNGSPDSSANQRELGIQTTWFLWTPDFPPGSRLLVTVYPSGTSSPSSGNFTNVLSSSDSSCLPVSAASMTPFESTSPSHANGPLIPSDEPSPTSSSSPAILASPRRGLSKGGIAGIAIAASLVGIGLIAPAAWCLLQRRKRVRQLEKGYDRSIVSPAFSDDAPTILYTGLSSTLASADAHKVNAPINPPTAILRSSSDAPDLRPTPYIVPPESLMSLSQSRGVGAKKHMRETSNESSLSMSTSDVRATTSSPSRLGTADVQDETGGGDGDGNVPVRVLRFDADGTAQLSAVGGNLGLELSEDAVGASDVASNSGEATLPPPYTQVLFQGRAE